MTTEKRNANLFASQCLFQSESAELGSHFWLVRITAYLQKFELLKTLVFIGDADMSQPAK
jgi:hypothetical protein